MENRIEDVATAIWKAHLSPEFQIASLTSMAARLFDSENDPMGWGPLMLLSPVTVGLMRQTFAWPQSRVFKNPNMFFQTRALLYYGEYELALGHIEAELRGIEQAYCGSLYEYTMGCFSKFTKNLEANLQEIIDPRLRFLAAISLCRSYLQICKERDLASIFLNEARLIAELVTEGRDRAIMIIRVRRYELELENTDITNLNSWWEEVAGIYASDSIVRESMRRLCDYLTKRALQENRWTDALQSAELASVLDPMCSRASYLLAKVNFGLGKFQEGRRFHTHSVLTGFDERDGGQFYKSAREMILKSPQFEAMSPFWRFGDSPIANGPIFTYSPYLSRLANLTTLDPLKYTLTCQRVIHPGFRREMSMAMLRGLEFKQIHCQTVSSFAYWLSFDENNAAFGERVHEARSLGILERCSVARTLSSLGFSNEALKLVEFPFDEWTKFSAEQSYAFATWFFLREILRPSAKEDFIHNLEVGFNKIVDSEETLRLRLALSMTSCVFFGNNKLIDDCYKWRTSGLKLLEDIHNTSQLDSFEKEILTSRFYRAASYAPFLASDTDVLLNDVVIIENLARGLNPLPGRQEILARENLYPMLETCSRIWGHIGDSDRAFELMIEIARDVDPADPKAWLQTGEALAQRGDLNGARQAYLRAGELGIPYGRIAWYKAGRSYEKLGELDDAMVCYYKSLEVWPGGRSPIERLSKLGPQVGLPHLLGWGNAMLVRI